MSYKVISYFCDVDEGSTYYSDHGKLFIENMKNLGIEYYVEKIKSKGSYRSNCLYKPHFILKCMNEFKCPIIWLDIDSYVHKKLDMFEKVNTDIIFATNSVNEKGKFIPKASPIYLNQTEKGINFVKNWIAKCDYYLENDKKFFDHEVMLEVLEEEPIEIGLFGKNFCLFANSDLNEKEAVITMGISGGKSKIKGLKDMGHSDHLIKGNACNTTYYTERGIIK
jgi:hypothetical protein